MSARAPTEDDVCKVILWILATYPFVIYVASSVDLCVDALRIQEAERATMSAEINTKGPLAWVVLGGERPSPETMIKASVPERIERSKRNWRERVAGRVEELAFSVQAVVNEVHKGIGGRRDRRQSSLCLAMVVALLCCGTVLLVHFVRERVRVPGISVSGANPCGPTRGSSIARRSLLLSPFLVLIASVAYIVIGDAMLIAEDRGRGRGDGVITELERRVLVMDRKEVRNSVLRLLPLATLGCGAVGLHLLREREKRVLQRPQVQAASARETT